MNRHNGGAQQIITPIPSGVNIKEVKRIEQEKLEIENTEKVEVIEVENIEIETTEPEVDGNKIEPEADENKMTNESMLLKLVDEAENEDELSHVKKLLATAKSTRTSKKTDTTVVNNINVFGAEKSTRNIDCKTNNRRKEMNSFKLLI
jgi:pyruvate/2-oxoacid:ferredoxin oxidoreductase beta subunit